MRLDDRENGYVFVDASTGFRDNGTWKADDSRLCAELQRTGTTCSDVRTLGERLLMKRASNGEIIELKTQ